MVKRLFTTDEIADQFGVRPPTVRAWAQYLDPPKVKIGKLLRWDPEELDVWIRAGNPAGLAAAMREAAQRRAARRAAEPVVAVRERRARRAAAR